MAEEHWQLSCSAWLQGITELPSEEDMWTQVARQHKFNRRSFTQVKRHALMVTAPAFHPLSRHAPCLISI